MATEHAPQSPSAQPSFDPVRPEARSHSSKVMLGETESTRTAWPFSRNSIALLISGEHRPLACRSRQPAANLIGVSFERQNTEPAFGTAAECYRLAACAPQ